MSLVSELDEEGRFNQSSDRTGELLFGSRTLSCVSFGGAG